jgi:hypothetical protein
VEFEKHVHLALIDVLYESQGQVLFNEIHQEAAEFRFFAEEILENHISQDLMVTYQAKKTNQKAISAAECIAEVRKVFLINQ